MADSKEPPTRVFLVGAGPGDPGLIALRAVECLSRADLVLYDYLVNPQILEHAPPQAELVCQGRHGQGKIMAQDQINQRLIDAATAGRVAVRLKSGDPAVFARMAEETDALSAAGIAYEIVPGITAALAAGSYAGIPITHRDKASAVALVTGHQADGAQPIDYAALAGFPGTLVFYMGVTTVGYWSAELMRGGQPASTPVAILRRCSWPDQSVVETVLGDLAKVVALEELRPPVIFVVGETVKTTESVTAAGSWFTRRPLFGQQVIVTRPRQQALDLRAKLARLGANVRVQPAIEILPPDDWGPVDAALSKMSDYDWLVFSSTNGAERLLERLLATGGDLRKLGGVGLAAVGRVTAEYLSQYHLHCDMFPERFDADALADALCPKAAGKRFLLARASRGREVLAERLQTAGAEVDQVVVYESRDVADADEHILAELLAGRVDWITVTSPAIARSLVALFGERLSQAKLVTISPLTSTALRQLGHEPAAEAREATMDGIIEILVESVRAGR